jgi:hypothetical protein
MKAYPYMHKHPTSGQTTISEGMDLRDYFAGIAMQTLIARQRTILADDVKESYEIADLMIQQRNYKEVPNEHNPAE